MQGYIRYVFSYAGRPLKKPETCRDRVALTAFSVIINYLSPRGNKMGIWYRPQLDDDCTGSLVYKQCLEFLRLISKLILLKSQCVFIADNKKDVHVPRMIGDGGSTTVLQ